MIERKRAERAAGLLVGAIQQMHSAFLVLDGQFSQEVNEEIKRTIGLAIGDLDTQCLNHIREVYPDLDHLAKLKPSAS